MQATRDTVYKGKIYVAGDEMPEDFDPTHSDTQAAKAAGVYRPEDRPGSSGSGEALTAENEPVNAAGNVNALDAAGNSTTGKPASKSAASKSGKRTRSELEAMTKADLVAEAEARGLEVERGDGGDGEPTKADYVDALAADDGE